MEIVRVLKEHWKHLSESAHAVSFNEFRPNDLDRIDFALIAEDEKTLEPLCYAVCREHDSRTIYVQFGGAFHGAKGTSMSFGSFIKGLDYLKARYERITMRIANDNKVMIKFAQKADFLIVGINNYNGMVLLEHLLEVKK